MTWKPLVTHLDLVGDVRSDQPQRNITFRLNIRCSTTDIDRTSQRNLRELRMSAEISKSVYSEPRFLSHKTSIATVKRYKNLEIITFLLVWVNFPYWNSAEIRSDEMQFRIVKVGQKTFSLPAWARECIKSKTRSGAPSVLPLVRMASLNSEGKTSIQFQMADLRCIAIIRWDSILILTSNEESSVRLLTMLREKTKKDARFRSTTKRVLSITQCDMNWRSIESGVDSGWVAMRLILDDKRSKTTFQFDAERWKITRPTYLAIRSLTTIEELTSDIWVFSYSALAAIIWDMDLMVIFDETELADGRLRSEVSAGSGRGGGGTDKALTGIFKFTLSSKSRKEVSVDRVATISGTSELAVWRMNNTMTLKIYLMQDSSRGGGSSHDDVVEVTEGAFGVRCLEPESDDRSSNEEWDECRVHREAIVMESTFKMRSCDWRTSIVIWPVCGSICWRKRCPMTICLVFYKAATHLCKTVQ